MNSLWPILLLAVVSLLVLSQFWWRRRCAGLEAQLAAGEQALSQAEAKLSQQAAQAGAREQALFDSMSDGVLLLNQQGRIQLANRALKKLLGLHTDPRGGTLLEAFRLDALNDLPKRLEREDKITGLEIEIGHVERRCLQVDAASIQGPDQERGMILVFHELTRLKQLENTRKEFVANVSHELRTPLSLIKGYVETLLDGAKNEPALLTRFLQTIQKNTDRLIFLIEDLLAISQLESGPPALNRQCVLLRPAVQKVFEDLQSLAKEKNIRLENELVSGLVVWADADRLQQVLMNLLDNAIKYGKVEGAVTVGGTMVESGAKVQVWVRDDGPGIPAEAQDRIFERFYRVDKARSREQGGTGLGLSIVKHIVQLHGGRVWVESEMGKGAAFFFTLPRPAS